jgi:hypothetical protein
MVTWKVEAALFPVAFRVRGHVVLGVMNAVLLAAVVWRLTANVWATVAGGLLVLGSGITLATMTYGFRNAKVLVMTLFLVAATVVLQKTGSRAPVAPGRLAALAAVTVLAVFTDEVALFVIPVIWFDVLRRAHGRRGALLAAGITAIVIGVLASASLAVARTVAHNAADTGALGKAMRGTVRLLFDEPVLRENVHAWTVYFLPRTVGAATDVAAGTAALGGIALLAVLGLAGRHRRDVAWRLVVALPLAGAALAVLLPHNAGVHSGLMPADARVPSLLYFSYYYPYPFTVILSLWLALLLAGVGGVRGVTALALVTVANAGAAWHARESPPDALAFHETGPAKLDAVRGMFALTSFARGLSPSAPAYVSFPIGPQTLVNCDLPAARRDPPDLRACLLPLLYLRDFESGRLRTSIENVVLARPNGQGEELIGARYFYDLPTARVLDLESLRRFGGLEETPRRVPAGGAAWALQRGPHRGPVVLLVRGASTVKVRGERALFVETQQYGQAYQLIEVPADVLAGTATTVWIGVFPEDPAITVFAMSAEAPAPDRVSPRP